MVTPELSVTVTSSEWVPTCVGSFTDQVANASVDVALTPLTLTLAMLPSASLAVPRTKIVEPSVNAFCGGNNIVAVGARLAKLELEFELELELALEIMDGFDVKDCDELVLLFDPPPPQAASVSVSNKKLMYFMRVCVLSFVITMVRPFYNNNLQLIKHVHPSLEFQKSTFAPNLKERIITDKMLIPQSTLTPKLVRH